MHEDTKTIHVHRKTFSIPDARTPSNVHHVPACDKRNSLQRLAEGEFVSRQPKWYSRCVVAKIPFCSTMVRLLRYLMNDYNLRVDRALSISQHRFNLNAFSNNQCLQDFRFRKSEIPEIMRLTGWTNATTLQNKY